MLAVFEVIDAQLLGETGPALHGGFGERQLGRVAAGLAHASEGPS